MGSHHIMSLLCSIYYYRILSKEKIVCEGLAGRSKRSLVQVVSTGHSISCGVVARKGIERSYVWEYETSACIL